MTRLSLFDTHAHLNVDAFDNRIDEVVQRARDAGLVGILVIGIDVATSRRACDLAAQYPGFLYAVVGIQPNSAAEAVEGDFQIIEELSGYAGVRAIGETGLDCYWDDTPIELQHEYFDRHLQLCRDTSLPMVIHMRDSGRLIVEQLKRQSTVPPGVMHSFTGDLPPLSMAGNSDADAVRASWQLLDSHGATHVYPGHGPLRPIAEMRA